LSLAPSRTPRREHSASYAVVVRSKLRAGAGCRRRGNGGTRRTGIGLRTGFYCCAKFGFAVEMS
jgi:hypothetical protein